MKTPHHKKINSRVACNLRYNSASTKVSGWGGVSASAGLFSDTTMRMLSVDAAEVDLSLRRNWDHSPVFLEGEG